MKNILIIGKNSYVGRMFEKHLKIFNEEFTITSISVRNREWENIDFSNYDTIFHVAAIVHKKEKPSMEELYYSINCNLPFEVANKAKNEGVNQFIFMSTMAVYGEIGKINQDVIINHESKVNPNSYYGESKVQAESRLLDLQNDEFKIVIIRPPMIYGPNCPGNFSKLEKIAKKSPIFPLIRNRRSMLHIDNLIKLLIEIIENDLEGLFLPQDNEYVNTSLLVKKIAKESGNKIILSRFLGILIEIFCGNISVFNKVFGNLTYERK